MSVALLFLMNGCTSSDAKQTMKQILSDIVINQTYELAHKKESIVYSEDHYTKSERDKEKSEIDRDTTKKRN